MMKKNKTMLPGLHSAQVLGSLHGNLSQAWVGAQAQSLRRDGCWYSSHMKSKYLRKEINSSLHAENISPDISNSTSLQLSYICPGSLPNTVYTEFYTLQVCDCFSFFFKIQSKRWNFVPFILIFPKGQRQSYSLHEEAEISRNFLPSHAWLYVSP